MRPYEIYPENVSGHDRRRIARSPAEADRLHAEEVTTA
jgi:hypothetical protein